LRHLGWQEPNVVVQSDGNVACEDGKDKIDAKIFILYFSSAHAPRTLQAKEQSIEWLSEQVQGSDKMGGESLDTGC
jgi:hypothetical protein